MVLATILHYLQKSFELNFLIIVEALCLFCVAEVCCCTCLGDSDCDLIWIYSVVPNQAIHSFSQYTFPSHNHKQLISKPSENVIHEHVYQKMQFKWIFCARDNIYLSWCFGFREVLTTEGFHNCFYLQIGKK